MGIKQAIVKLFGGHPTPIAKSSRTSGVDLLESGWGNPSPHNTDELQRVIAESPWVYRCVEANATSVLQTPVMVKTIDGEDADETITKEVKALLANPNPLQTWEEFAPAIIRSLELTGDAHIEWVIDAGKREAWVLDSARIMPIPHARDMIGGYRYRGLNGRDVKFTSDELIRLSYPDPNNRLHGLPPIKAAEKELIADFFATKHNAAFFQNGATMRGVIETSESYDPDAAERFRERWRQLYSGADNAHKIAILYGDMEYKAIGVTPKDMEFIEMRKWAREAVLAAFGVPPVLVGVFEYANYANSREQMKMYWQSTMTPKIRILQSGLTRLVQKLWQRSDIKIEFDITQVEALQETREQTMGVVGQMVLDGIITRNEARVELGFAPSLDKAMDVATVSAGTVPLADAVAPVEFGADVDTDGKPVADSFQPDLDISRLSLAIERLSTSENPKDMALANQLRARMRRIAGAEIPV